MQRVHNNHTLNHYIIYREYCENISLENPSLVLNSYIEPFDTVIRFAVIGAPSYHLACGPTIGYNFANLQHGRILGERFGNKSSMNNNKHGPR
jgi:hypothetical protein